MIAGIGMLSARPWAAKLEYAAVRWAALLGFGLVVEGAAVGVAVGWLAATGTAIPFGSTVVAGLALGPGATGLAAGFGVGIGAAIPNQVAAVLIAFGWVMVAEQLLSGLVPAVAQWLPFTGAGTAFAGSQHPEIGAATGVGLFLLYLVVVVGTQTAVATSSETTPGYPVRAPGTDPKEHGLQ